MKTAKMFVVACALTSASMAMAQIDGVREASYGAPLAVQQVQTQFGDSNLGQVASANGSELNAAYCRGDGSNVNLMLTGNLESNFNKLEIFFDFRSGGFNQLNGSIPGAGNLNGLRFDAGFEADFWISVTCGGGPFGVYINAWDLGGGSPSDYLGSNGGSGALSGGNNFVGMNFALNNSNTGGVSAGTGAADQAAAAAVTTGIEFSLPLALFGGSVNGVKVSTFVNGGGHDFLSNQVLGAAPAGSSNFGGPGGVNFANVAGDQFFVLPSPSAAVLAGLAGLFAGRRRR